MMAMKSNYVDMVRMLLVSESVNLALGDLHSGRTALHWGCLGFSVESVRLFLAHPQCTQEIVRMEDRRGQTAEMIATRDGARAQECFRLLNEYLDGSIESVDKKPRPAPASPSQVSALSLGQLAAALARMESQEAEQKRSKDALKEALEKVEREEAELMRRKEALTAALLERAGPSLVPECLVCLVKMEPPLQIYTCSNGHLICHICKPRICGNLCVTRCQGSYTGRATAVEQIVRKTLGIE